VRRADAGRPEGRLGRQRDQARRRHDRRGDQPAQPPGQRRPAGRRDPPRHGEPVPRGGHARARGPRGVRNRLL
ncbi:MAG: hypothetical protein AVDCRST_MAG45-2618, partial [uncultured Solirubrobacterales bacterium]